jgi:DNA-binding response OmpR family regulator
MAHLFLLDDEADLREEVADFLRVVGHRVTEVGSLGEFRARHQQERCEIALIDRLLPDGDGLELVDELRRKHADCGLIVLTARDASVERVSGYQHGADHYVTKPVNLDLLAAIVGALGRRLPPQGRWELLPGRWCLLCPSGRSVALTAQEFSFLAALARSEMQVLTRKKILIAIGKDYLSYDPRSLDALLLRLRRKVLAAGGGELPIKTVHGVGYVLSEPLHLSGGLS